MKTVAGPIRFLFLMLPAVYAFAHDAGAPPGHAGALGQPTCAAVGCHDSHPVNSGPGHLAVWPIAWPNIRTTIMEVRFVAAPGARWGIQATQRAPYSAYHMQPVWVDSLRTHLVAQSDTSYFTHTLAGTGIAPPDSQPSWKIAYTVGDSNLMADAPCPWVFASGVAADGDGTPAGDFVYTAESPFYEGLCMCRWEMTGDLNHNGSITSGDLLALVRVVFKGDPLPEPCVMADVQCDGKINSADLIYLVNTIFKGGLGPCDGSDYSPLLFEDLYCR